MRPENALREVGMPQDWEGVGGTSAVVSVSEGSGKGEGDDEDDE